MSYIRISKQIIPTIGEELNYDKLQCHTLVLYIHACHSLVLKLMKLHIDLYRRRKM